MPLEVFREGENVQAIDESVYIWANAKILARVSDWEVKVKWTDYPHCQPDIITVPEMSRHDREDWNIRKSQKISDEPETRRRNIRQMSTPLTYKPRTLSRHDRVKCFQDIVITG